MRGLGRAYTYSGYEALALSFLLLQTVAFWLIIRACGLDFSFVGGIVVYLVVHVGTSVPDAPAGVGLFQFFCIVGLRIFHVQKTFAAGFSVVVFLFLGLPASITGLFALKASRVGIGTVWRRTWKDGKANKSAAGLCDVTPSFCRTAISSPC